MSSGMCSLMASEASQGNATAPALIADERRGAGRGMSPLASGDGRCPIQIDEVLRSVANRATTRNNGSMKLTCARYAMFPTDVVCDANRRLFSEEALVSTVYDRMDKYLIEGRLVLKA